MEEYNKSPVNTLEEVKKLQDLVRQLELQNQQLMNNHIKFPKKNSRLNCNDVTRTIQPNVLKFSNSENVDVPEEIIHLGKNKNYNSFEPEIEENAENAKSSENTNYLDEIDIIRISDVEMSDDESWLYMSPKGLTPEQKNESPYKWLRKDVDDLENKELQLAKKALITKLNELEILSPTSQTNHPTQDMFRTISRPIVSHISQSSIQCRSPYSAIDTRTFTKSRKKQALEYLSSSPQMENFHDIDKKEPEFCRKGSDISLDSSTGTYTLTDANDVQEVARLQEESLRLSSPLSTPKRQSVASTVSNHRLSISSRSSISDIDNAEQPASLSNQLSIESNASDVVPTSFVSLPNSKVSEHHSNNSSPSESPYGSNISLDSVGRKKEPYRSSLPNLNRNTLGLKSKRSVVTHESRQQKSFITRTIASGRKSDSNLLGVNKPHKSLPSPTRQKQSNCLSSTASGVSNLDYSSKTIKFNRSVGRLPVKSGLPRPTRATSATRVGSGIPMPSTMSKKCEDSWSDGCF